MKTYNDTVYQHFDDGRAIPLFRSMIDKHKLSREYMKGRSYKASDRLQDYTAILGIHFLPNYLVASVIDKDFINVYYNLKSGETFSVGRKTACDVYESPYKWIFSSMENDIYGFEPLYLGNYYYPKQNLCVQVFSTGYATHWLDKDYVRQLNVSQPEIRDQLLEYCENPSDELGMILILMHLK